MRESIDALFGEFAQILAICPNPECGFLFRLSDARPYFGGKPSPSILDDIESEERKIERAREKLNEQEDELRRAARKQGQMEADRRLQQLDTVFSTRKLEPQDVALLFDPVEYIVFDGLHRNELQRVLFLSHPPASRAAERTFRSISEVVRRGDVLFKTLKVSESGALKIA